MRTWSSVIRRIAFSVGLVTLFGLSLVVVGGGFQSDNGQLVFWSRQDSSYAVHVIDPYHLITFRLIEPPPYQVVDLPRFALNGQQVAFETVDNGRLRVFVKDTHQNTLYVTDTSGIEDHMPVLSPDGRQLAFWSAPYSRRSNRFQNWNFYIVDLDTTTSRQITSQLAILPSDIPFWSPDGGYIAVRFWRAGVDEGAFVVDVESGQMHNIPGDVDPSSDLVWSPDGAQIAFRSARDLNPEVYIMEIDSGETRNLTQHEANDFQPVWSPNQQQIAFVSNRSGAGNIYLINKDGTALTQLTDRGGWQPGWSPSGDRVTFLTLKNGRTALYIVDTDGSHLQFIAYLTSYDFFLGWYGVRR